MTIRSAYSCTARHARASSSSASSLASGRAERRIGSRDQGWMTWQINAQIIFYVQSF
jgi:hypothetical protein